MAGTVNLLVNDDQSGSDAPAKDEVHWFSIPVTRERCPWAYEKGSPQRCISALELLGTVMLIKMISERLQEGEVRVGGVAEDLQHPL